MTPPSLVLSSPHSLRVKALTDTDAVVLLNVTRDPIVKDINKSSPPLFLSLWMNDTFPVGIEEAEDEGFMLPYATVEDFAAFNDFLFCVSHCKRVYLVYEEGDETLAFVLLTGAHLNFGLTLAEAIYRATKAFPLAEPSALWPIMCLDKALNMGMELTTAYNDYYASRTAVSSTGKIAEGHF